MSRVLAVAEWVFSSSTLETLALGMEKDDDGTPSWAKEGERVVESYIGEGDKAG